MGVAPPSGGTWLDQLCEVLERIPHAVAVTDMKIPGLPMTFCNAAMVALTGYSKQNSQGRNCRFLQGKRTEAAAVRVAAAEGVPVVDVHTLMLADDKWPQYVGADLASGDGLHLSPEGQRFVARKLLALLAQEMALPVPIEGISPQERLMIDVPTLPVHLPPGVRMPPAGFEALIEAHEERRRAAYL